MAKIATIIRMGAEPAIPCANNPATLTITIWLNFRCFEGARLQARRQSLIENPALAAEGTNPQGLKANRSDIPTARLKPCPFKSEYATWRNLRPACRHCANLQDQPHTTPSPAIGALWDVRGLPTEHRDSSAQSASIERNRPSSASLPARQRWFFPAPVFYRVFRKSGSARERIVPPGCDSPV